MRSVELSMREPMNLQHMQIQPFWTAQTKTKHLFIQYFMLLLRSVEPVSIHNMTNFSPAKLSRLYDKFEPFESPLWFHGRGKRRSFRTFDVLSMMLTVMKNGGAEDFLAAILKIFQLKIFQTTLPGTTVKYVEYVSRQAFSWLLDRNLSYYKINFLSKWLAN